MSINGNSGKILLGVFATFIATIVIALSGWTLKKVSDLSVDVAREEQDVLWIKNLLYRKLKDLPLKDDGEN